MRHLLKVVLLLLIVRSNAGYSLPNDAAGSGSEVVTTRHTISLRGSPLTYTARAGFIPILDEASGEVHAKIFFVSYTAVPQSGEPPRPLTFVTAGRPGEPATLSDSGPRWFKGATVEQPLPPPPYELVDNPGTWLAMTDLVLIDPVGSGYSHATKPEYAGQYYNPDADAESVAQFMQRYLRRYERAEPRPLFVAGTSYGSIRSALIADIATRRAIPLRGLILAASALAEQPRLTRRNPRKGELPWTLSDLSYIQLLPTFTATAFAHKKLPPDLQRNFDAALGTAETWAAREYPALLAQSATLSSEQLGAAAAQMARLTGLPPDVIREHQLRLLPDVFLRELLGADYSPLGLVDSRKTKADEATGGANPLTWYSVPASLYLGGELHFRSDVPYDPGTLTLIRGWRCSASTTHCADPQALMNLQHAMRANPSLRVMITSGYYDLNCPYFGTQLALSHFDSDLRARVNVIYYQAGHHAPPEHRPAVARFIQGTLAMSRKTGGVHAQSSR